MEHPVGPVAWQTASFLPWWSETLIVVTLSGELIRMSMSKTTNVPSAGKPSAADRLPLTRRPTYCDQADLLCMRKPTSPPPDILLLLNMYSGTRRTCASTVKNWCA